MRLNTGNIEARFYLNGFPKAGLHLLDMMMRPLAAPMPYDPVWITPWAGMFQGNSFSLERIRTESITMKLSRCMKGHFMKGHMGYDENIDRFLYYMGMVHYFVYRDLRDVAVSTTYHAIDPNDLIFNHPAKKELAEMDNFDDQLAAIIAGYGDYPGILDRWVFYAPWLDIPHVMKLRYEDLLLDRHNWARQIILHMFERMGFVLLIPPEETHLTEEQLDGVAEEMVDLSNRTDASPTFRKGITGEWKTHFKEWHKDLFKELDVNQWLIQLGYEQGDNW